MRFPGECTPGGWSWSQNDSENALKVVKMNEHVQ